MSRSPRNPCKHPEKRQEEMLPSNASPGTALWAWWWCKDCGAVQMRFKRDKDGVRLCGGSKNLENWRSPKLFREQLDKTDEAHRMFLKQAARATLAVRAKDKLVEAISSLCGLTGSREHLDPEQCLNHVREHLTPPQCEFYVGGRECRQTSIRCDHQTEDPDDHTKFCKVLGVGSPPKCDDCEECQRVCALTGKGIYEGVKFRASWCPKEKS